MLQQWTLFSATIFVLDEHNILFSRPFSLSHHFASYYILLNKTKYDERYSLKSSTSYIWLLPKYACILVSKYRVIMFWPCKNDMFFIIVFPYFAFVLNDTLSGIKTRHKKRCSVKSSTSCILSLLYLFYLLLSNRTKFAPMIFRPRVNNTIVFC